MLFSGENMFGEVVSGEVLSREVLPSFPEKILQNTRIILLKVKVTSTRFLIKLEICITRPISRYYKIVKTQKGWGGV
jgi:hypothetical protein